jgi:hypothetical protein
LSVCYRKAKERSLECFLESGFPRGVRFGATRDSRTITTGAELKIDHFIVTRKLSAGIGL